MKVINVSNDSMFVSPKEYEISKMSKIYKINKPENYSESFYGISRQKLREMYDSKEIFDIIQIRIESKQKTIYNTI